MRIDVRDIADPADMSACAALYAEVMGLRPEDGSINPRLLVALQANGGLVLGAYDACNGAQPIGFSYSFLAREAVGQRRMYQYSQLTVVDARSQGRGVGRALKFAQRDRCLADGIATIRWAYDPLKTRNAHFNLDVLGARVVRLVPSMYGPTGFGADSGDDTDRFIVEWDLDETAGVPPPRDADLQITLPQNWPEFRRAAGPHQAAATRRRLSGEFAHALATGRVGVSCVAADQHTAAYRFAAAPEFVR